VGPLEEVMYKTLGAKVDFLSEADLLDELGRVAMVKTNTEVQDEDHHAMENPVESTLTHYMTVSYKGTPRYVAHRHSACKPNSMEGILL
jgi:hypothetical protein